MKIQEVETDKQFEIEVKSMNSDSIVPNDALSDFSFDWNLEKEKEIFGLIIKKRNELVGLMAITDVKNELRIHIDLIESSIHNRGKNKLYKNIPKCLIAYAAKLAFLYGYDGFVSLYPKSELVEYYKKEYGFEQFGYLLAIYGQTSFELIQKVSHGK